MIAKQSASRKPRKGSVEASMARLHAEAKERREAREAREAESDGASPSGATGPSSGAGSSSSGAGSSSGGAGSFSGVGPSSAAVDHSDDEVECTGTRTREDRDYELQQQAVDVDEE